MKRPTVVIVMSSTSEMLCQLASIHTSAIEKKMERSVKFHADSVVVTWLTCLESTEITHWRSTEKRALFLFGSCLLVGIRVVRRHVLKGSISARFILVKLHLFSVHVESRAIGRNFLN